MLFTVFTLKPSEAKAEVMKKLIQRTKTMRPNREHCRASRICKTQNNLKRQSLNWLSFFIFTANASVSDAGADEKSYPAKEDYATEEGALSSRRVSRICINRKKLKDSHKKWLSFSFDLNLRLYKILSNKKNN